MVITGYFIVLAADHHKMLFMMYPVHRCLKRERLNKHSAGMCVPVGHRRFSMH